MTQDVDIVSTRAAELAEQLRDHLSTRFHIAVRVREIGEGRGYRLYQIQKPKNRHLVDVRPVAALPPARRIGEVLVVAPEELIAGKLIAYQRRLRDAEIRDRLARSGRVAPGVSRIEDELRAGPRSPRSSRGDAGGRCGVGKPRESANQRREG